MDNLGHLQEAAARANRRVAVVGRVRTSAANAYDVAEALAKAGARTDNVRSTMVGSPVPVRSLVVVPADAAGSSGNPQGAAV